MIIGISGKIGSGKDTVGNIIQYLTSKYKAGYTYLSSQQTFEEFNKNGHRIKSDWQIKKFAYKLKQIVSILTGIAIEDLEKQEIKNQLLGEEWTRYGYADGFEHHYKGGEKVLTVMNNVECSKEKYERERIINWQTAYKHEYSVRDLLQIIGTNLFRDKLLQNIWVNALFADYKTTQYIDRTEAKRKNIDDSNWIITDMRFQNELEAVKQRNGITIRIQRPAYERLKSNNPSLNWEEAEEINNSDLKAAAELYDRAKKEVKQEHPSETALDNATFDYTVDNNGTIEELIEKVRQILIKEKIING